MKYALLLCWGSGGTRGPPRKGKMCCLRSFDPALIRQTDRLHIYNGLWRPGPSHPVKLQRFEPPSKSGKRITDSGPHARNLMNVSRILLFAFSVLARLSFCSFWFVFRIRRMSEGICFFLVEIANRLQRFCSCGGPFLCLFS